MEQSEHRISELRLRATSEVESSETCLSAWTLSSTLRLTIIFLKELSLRYQNFDHEPTVNVTDVSAKVRVVFESISTRLREIVHRQNLTIPQPRQRHNQHTWRLTLCACGSAHLIKNEFIDLRVVVLHNRMGQVRPPGFEACRQFTVSQAASAAFTPAHKLLQIPPD